jgi:hypothetical protein
VSGKNLSERGKTPMSEVKFKIFCDNVECKDCGKEVNEITFEDISEEDAMSFAESFGHGGEDDTDYCPTCQELGNLSEV